MENPVTAEDLIAYLQKLPKDTKILVGSIVDHGDLMVYGPISDVQYLERHNNVLFLSVEK